MVNKKVLILYKFLPQWRVDFFNYLREYLAKENIELSIVYGKLKNLNAKKNDEAELEWGKYRPNVVINVGKTELLLQPAFIEILNADLIIVEQANKLLINYLLIIVRKITLKKVAFWGHGINLQDEPNSIRNQFKKLYSRQSDWWFSYTNNVKDIVKSIGYPEAKITVVQNAIDTKRLINYYNGVSDIEIKSLKHTHLIYNGPIGLFCGGMYAEKRLNFLLESCKAIRKAIPSFEMIFIGAGPEVYKIKNAAMQYKWIHYLGTKFNEDKVPFLKWLMFS